MLNQVVSNALTRPVSHAFGRWTLDVYAGVWLFSANDNFLGRTREQDPLASTQVHLIYTVRRGLWVAFDANFFAGGRRRSMASRTWTCSEIPESARRCRYRFVGVTR